MDAKKKILATAITCVLVLLAVSVFTGFWTRQDRDTSLKVGFICSEDESTPYTYNFLQGVYALQETYERSTGSRFRFTSGAMFIRMSWRNPCES